jgi:hypothetical protein
MGTRYDEAVSMVKRALANKGFECTISVHEANPQ